MLLLRLAAQAPYAPSMRAARGIVTVVTGNGALAVAVSL
jgi:hypothetical protein